MESPVCYKCSGGMDISGTVQLKQIEKIIGTNYSILGIFILLLIVSIISFYYIFSLLYRELKMFLGFKKKAIHDDQEYYDDTKDLKYNVSNYYDKGKQDFLNNMKKEYKDYNDFKSNYIRTNFNTDNNDLIDEKILFNKYDNY